MLLCVPKKFYKYIYIYIYVTKQSNPYKRRKPQNSTKPQQSNCNLNSTKPQQTNPIFLT